MGHRNFFCCSGKHDNLVASLPSIRLRRVRTERGEEWLLQRRFVICSETSRTKPTSSASSRKVTPGRFDFTYCASNGCDSHASILLVLSHDSVFFFASEIASHHQTRKTYTIQLGENELVLKVSTVSSKSYFLVQSMTSICRFYVSSGEDHKIRMHLVSIFFMLSSVDQPWWEDDDFLHNLFSDVSVLRMEKQKFFWIF